MYTESERDLFICYGSFVCESKCNQSEGLYKFKSSRGDIYLTRKGLQARLEHLINKRELHDQTERALELHP